MSGLSQDAEREQRRAADPLASAWVGANAGTGKTKVLTDRVLNLLLAGTAPERILCLTFTKAAAAEMANRLSGKLARWAITDDATLADDLAKLTGEVADPARLATARRLFARVLDVPGGMKIETIHAFCQSLLRRFPLEAGVSPHFQVLEGRDSEELLHAARERLLIEARRTPTSALAEALSVVTRQVHETMFPDLMTALTYARGTLKRLFARPGGRPAVVAAVRDRLGLADGETPASLLAAACSEARVNRSDLLALAQALAGGGKTDSSSAEAILAWVQADEADRAEGWATYNGAYLTASGEPRAASRFPTKAVREGRPDVLPTLTAETDRILWVNERIKSASVAEATEALLILAEALIGTYEAAKSQTGKLDFDDLILAAQTLLADSEAASWVLFKLDGGLDHVMIDEAQDTNPNQWAVIDGLVSEFFAGEGVRPDVLRTVFAVGDRKQSIYSFQGADPEEFERQRAKFAADVGTVAGRFEDVQLAVSFRSTPAVLEVVNQVFSAAPATHGVVLDGDTFTHLAHRQGQAGLVELWPPVQALTTDFPDAWKPPVERVSTQSASSRLAGVIARRISRMTSGAEMLESQGRPVRPGDVMVLVRRRGGFVEDLVRALKTLNVPVAGVDRMVLTEQLAVMDLLALAAVLLLPDDDLGLATVLKGPLIGLQEDQLFDLAHGRPRGVSLWRRLRDRGATAGPFQDAYRLLDHLRDRADFLPPHELFAEILGPLGGRRKLLGRLGPDAADPLDEFVQLTLTYDRAHPPSLQAFLHWVTAGATEIKRDLEEAADKVRVMTVHGSKGLQAPVVFLPDTRQVPTKSPLLTWDHDAAGPLLAWAPKAALREPWTQGLVDAAKTAQDREYNRLLYVALTRAEDRLYVCGWETAREAPDHCWYNQVERALTAIGAQVEDADLAADDGMPSGKVWRYTSQQTVPAARRDEARMSRDDGTPLPDWIADRAAAEPSPARPLAPSKPLLPEPPVRSPLTVEDDGARFQRGLLVHRLLETLPALPVANRLPAAQAYLARPVWNLDPAKQASLVAETLAVLEHPDMAALFGPESLPEVPITGLVGGHVVSGQVDRLLVSADTVHVIDYKTNRPPPRRVEDVPAAYLFQMAAYRAVLGGLYPGRDIRCTLLWTDGPFLMDLPPAAMDDTFQSHLMEPRR